MSQALDKDTIAAQATAAGRASVGIIRLSGPRAKEIGECIGNITLRARYAHFAHFQIHDQHNQSAVIDQGIMLFFQQPHYFTGEDVVELQAHGGPVVLDLLLKECLSLGARQARAGEFSERAFLNDKIDLAQAEAIADLIEASSEKAARNAINTLQGSFSQRIRELNDELIALRLYIEAAIDFPEEEIDFIKDSHVQTHLGTLIEHVDTILAQVKQGSLLREGITAVILGRPNAGKSSLLNALVGKDSAIVTDIQGTTRDVLREHIIMDDLPIHIIDTAGLRESSDIIEQEGIKRAIAMAEQADIILIVQDMSQTNQRDGLSILDSLKHNIVIKENTPLLFIHNKCDLSATEPTVEYINDCQQHIYLSAKQHQGIDLLKQAIKRVVNFQDQQEGLFSARQRHQQALIHTKRHLQNGFSQLREYNAAELLAEDLRQAQQTLNQITGEFSADDLLGEIFGSFCIGK